MGDPPGDRPPDSTDGSTRADGDTGPRRARVVAGLTDRISSASPFDALVGCLLVVAAGLRLYRLGDESFWLDEAITWYFVTEKYTTAEILFVLPIEDVHPPLYFLLIDLWVSLAGASESALRFPSAVLGIASVGLLYLLGVKLFDRWTGLIAAALLSVSSFHLYYAQEARMYTLLTALTVVSFYFFVDLVSEESYGRLSVLGYVVATVLLAYTHLFGMFVVLAQNSYLLPRAVLSSRTWPVIGRLESTSASLRDWLGIQGIVILMAAPWWGTILFRLPSISSGGCAGITWIPEPLPADVVTVLKRYFYYCGNPSEMSPIPEVVFLFVMALAGGLAVIGLFGSDRRPGLGRPGSVELVVLVWLLTLIVVPYVLSHTVTPILIARYTIGASIALFLLVGRGVQRLRPYAPTAVRVALVGVLLVGIVAPLSGYYEDDQKRQWRDAVSSIDATDDDLVLVTKPHLVP
ncbi:MAG: glycosyltransferase family 39 protein, partial [Halovenus sp.]